MFTLECKPGVAVKTSGVAVQTATAPAGAGQVLVYPDALNVIGPDGSVPIAKSAVVPLTSVTLRTTGCERLGGLAETTRHRTPDGATVMAAESSVTSGS